MAEDDASLPGPTSSFFVSQGLRLHYVDWGNEGAPPLVLVHGGRDHARSFDRVARALRRDFHVVAPDLRGHGDSEHPTGGSYHMANFVLDLARLVEWTAPGEVTLVGHSLGGAIVLYYAGTFPECVAKVVSIEGLGAPPEMRERLLAVAAPDRLRQWVEEQRALAARRPRRYASLEEAAARMRSENAFLSPELATHLTRHAVARNEDGTLSWKFDPAIRSSIPDRPDFEGLEAIWARVTCPVLLARGTKSWASDPALDGRIRHFRNARLVNVEEAGHWVHHDQPEEFLRVVQGFLAEA